MSIFLLSPAIRLRPQGRNLHSEGCLLSLQDQIPDACVHGLQRHKLMEWPLKPADMELLGGRPGSLKLPRHQGLLRIFWQWNQHDATWTTMSLTPAQCNPGPRFPFS